MDCVDFCGQCGRCQQLVSVDQVGSLHRCLRSGWDDGCDVLRLDGYEDCLAVLVEAGCDIEAVSSNGKTAYQFAKREREKSCEAMLLAESERRAMSASVPNVAKKALSVRV